MKQEEVSFPTWTDHVDSIWGAYTGHPVPSLHLAPTFCDFHSSESFIISSLCLEACVAMHYFNHRGYAGCRLCLLCIVFSMDWRWWHAWDRTSADAREAFGFNNRFVWLLDWWHQLFLFKGAPAKPAVLCSDRKRSIPHLQIQISLFFWILSFSYFLSFSTIPPI